MAKDKSAKKEKKEKKVSVIEDPVDDPTTKVSKKEKKEKKSKSKHKEDAAAKLLDNLGKKEQLESEEESEGEGAGAAVSRAARDELLVPFAKPLADDKVAKKIFKTVKRAAKNKSLKRGVKEVVKALRKSPTTGAAALVILAADISPMDVISHIPVLCEDHNIPYIFVKSRAELGAAGATKRPTSVVMIVPGSGIAKDKKKKKKGGDEMEVDEKEAKDDGFKEAYDDAVKLVEAASRA